MDKIHIVNPDSDGYSYCGIYLPDSLPPDDLDDFLDWLGKHETNWTLSSNISRCKNICQKCKEIYTNGNSQECFCSIETIMIKGCQCGGI